MTVFAIAKIECRKPILKGLRERLDQLLTYITRGKSWALKYPQATALETPRGKGELLGREKQSLLIRKKTNEGVRRQKGEGASKKGNLVFYPH